MDFIQNFIIDWIQYWNGWSPQVLNNHHGTFVLISAFVLLGIMIATLFLKYEQNTRQGIVYISIFGFIFLSSITSTMIPNKDYYVECKSEPGNAMLDNKDYKGIVVKCHERSVIGEDFGEWKVMSFIFKS